MTVIDIQWPAGRERIELDLIRLSEQTDITYSDQHIDETNTDFLYKIVSTIKQLKGGGFKIILNYSPEVNSHLARDDS